MVMTLETTQFTFFASVLFFNVLITESQSVVLRFGNGLAKILILENSAKPTRAALLKLFFMFVHGKFVQKCLFLHFKYKRLILKKQIWLRVSSYELVVMSYELVVMSYELVVMS
jgi:hypothetical protein